MAVQSANQTLDKFLFANNAGNATGAKTEAEKLNDTGASQSVNSTTLQCRRASMWNELKIKGWSSECNSIQKLLCYIRTQKLGSEATKRSYCYVIWRFCRLSNTTPDVLLNLNADKIKDLFSNFVLKLLEENKSLKYIKQYADALKAFFKANERRDVNIKAPKIPPRYRKREGYVPTPGEALKMASCATSLRDRAIILLLAFSGLRASTLRALRHKDVMDEINKGLENICIYVYPDMKQVVPEACKGNLFYRTFTIREGTECLKQYLQEKEYGYGSLAPDEPIFNTTDRKLGREERRMKPLTIHQIDKIIKKAARLADIEKWADVSSLSLRKTFQMFLSGQPSSCRLDFRDQEFLFGHKLPWSSENYYDFTKVELLREKFSRMISDPFVEHRRKQCTVPLSDLDKYLAEGWIAKIALQDGRVVVEKEYS